MSAAGRRGVIESDRLPRRLAPGIDWLAACTALPYEGRLVHSYHSVYLIAGEERSLIVDTGHPKDWRALERQLDEVLADGRPPVRHLVPTHTEVPHAGSLGRLARKFPDAEIVGDVRDLHLYMPEIADRLTPARVGDEIDLGGRSFRFVTPVIRDLATTLWGYDTAQRVLFTGDGFAYMHHHEPHECGLYAEQTPELPLAEFTAVFAQYALYWTLHTDMTEHLRELDELFAAQPIDLVAPGHGSPIVDLEQTLPKVREGLAAANELLRPR